MGYSTLRIWPGLPLDVYAREPRARLPFPLDQPQVTLFRRARQGLYAGARAVGLKPGDEVLIPAYHHGSEVEALLRAGVTCRFYDVSETLEPDERELEARSGSRTRALYLIHYFGFPQDVVRWRAWCDERGLLLFEDVALAWLGSAGDKPLGSFGDISIFCLYKTLGLPDGGALAMRSHSAHLDGPRRVGLRQLLFLHARWLESRNRLAARVNATVAPLAPDEPVADASVEFVLDARGELPTAATTFALPRLADAAIAARRRANYQILLEELLELVPSPFTVLPSGASPLIFPIVHDRADEVIACLRREGIEASRFWRALHPALPHEDFPNAGAWRSRLIALPVHQELQLRDVERIAASVRSRSARRSGARIERVDGLEAIRDEWNVLTETTRNIFGSWEWVSTWWQHFGSAGTLVPAVCRQDDKAIAILPLYLSRIGVFRTIRFLGHGQADELGPICAESDTARAAGALRHILDDAAFKWDIFLGETVRADIGWSALIGARTVSRTANPIIRLHGQTWDEFLALLSPRLRHEIRHDERKLARDHDIRFRLVEDSDRLERDLDSLFALHRARWGNSGFAQDHRFHRAFARRAFARGWLRLWFLDVAGHPVAAWYGFRFRGIESFYQAGRDPNWDKWSVGLVLAAHTLREAIADGLREYRFLRGAEGYKFRFATHDPGLETVARGRGITAEAAVAARAIRANRRG
jgi:dTDP-4-amino-4,6-dideoxygalactose transaminase/CelD/BcsL family acetyltransferase involved in cellulose biosynthesis